MKYMTLVFALILTTSAFAEVKKYKVDDTHTNVGFTIKHLVVTNVRGKFDKFEGAIELDPSNLATLKVNATVMATSINTNTKKRDDHLRSPDFFDVAKFPKLTFVSKKIENVSGNKAKMVADLTIKNVTKPVTFDVEYAGAAKDPWGNSKAAFSASAEIERGDFGLTWNKPLETGGLLVGTKVKIELDVEADEVVKK